MTVRASTLALKFEKLPSKAMVDLMSRGLGLVIPRERRLIELYMRLRIHY